MTTSLVDADSVLAIDVGTVTTRAFLFDAVGGNYRFLAVGTSPTTLSAPLNDVSEGIRQAVENLQEISGRTLLDTGDQLILPSDAGTGVDMVVATVSAGTPLKVIAVGLLDDISLESARNLAISTYAKVVESMGMNDRRKPEKRIDMLMALNPDLLVVAGGTDNGASRSVLKLLDSVGLACYLTPKSQRPHILFAGNPQVAEEVEALLESYSTLHIAPNVRPTLEDEQLGAAQAELRSIFRQVRVQNNPGMQELDGWTGGRLMPAAEAFGRVIRFSSWDHAEKGALGVDLGAGSTTVAAAFNGDLQLNVYAQLGLGAGLVNLLKYTKTENITRWLPFDASENDIRDYIYHKSIYPASIPITPEDLAIEHALAREILRTVARGVRKRFPASPAPPIPGVFPRFEPIIASGSVFTKAPTRGQSMLMLLDGLEPTGITTVFLDQNNVFSSLGAIAEINAILAVQVLTSGPLLNLGTVISPVGNAQYGTPVLRVRVQYESGEEKNVDVKQGSLEVIPLSTGQTASVALRPLHRYDIGMGGAGRGGKINRVVGGALGIVIDARGRPFQPASDLARRQDLLKKQMWKLDN